MLSSVVWLKDDFRTINNPAISSLINEKKSAKKVIYIFDKDKYQKQEAQRWWLAKSLEVFQEKLQELNITLDIISGNAEKIIKNLVNNKKIDKIFWNKSCHLDENRAELSVKKILIENNIIFREFNSNLLNPVEKVKKDDGTPFKVFTHYWKKAEKIYLENNQKIDEKISSYSKKKKINKGIEAIYPKKNWNKKFEKYWDPSEEKAIEILNHFIKNNIEYYATNRDIPSLSGTSKLSPYLKFGQISVHQIMNRCLMIKSKNISFRKFINEIGWREFSHSLLHNFPEMENNNLRKEFDKFNWINNNEFLKKWKKGLTGYPIVDAGMRELYETGWMHNRVRMITASFLVKHLRIHWKEGEKYFRNSLLDFNIANNVSGWQWVAGTGADAAPYFRIFNPILQGEKFDPNGEYVTQWCPELKNVPIEFLHKPWEMPEQLQNQINFKLGHSYPLPIVKHVEARNSALKAFQDLKK